MIYDFYIFDRHCNCIFFVSWHGAEGRFETRSPPSHPPPAATEATNTSSVPTTSGIVSGSNPNVSSSQVPANSQKAGTGHSGSQSHLEGRASEGAPSGASGDENAKFQQVMEHTKLVYGVVYSLKNVSRKLKMNKG
jgi:hypothetical protein